MVPVAVKMLRDVGLLLSPILSNVMTRKEEGVLRYEAEAMCSLNSIEPSEVGLLAIVDQIVLAAEHVTGAERVCLFFVDDVANELWVGKSIDFDDARLKVGQGLCGYAARTGQTVNVVNSYEDSRFDSSWDKRTGFVTRRSEFCFYYLSGSFCVNSYILLDPNLTQDSLHFSQACLRTSNIG